MEVVLVSAGVVFRDSVFHGVGVFDHEMLEG